MIMAGDNWQPGLAGALPYRSVASGGGLAGESYPLFQVGEELTGSASGLGSATALSAPSGNRGQQAPDPPGSEAFVPSLFRQTREDNERCPSMIIG